MKKGEGLKLMGERGRVNGEGRRVMGEKWKVKGER